MAKRAKKSPTKLEMRFVSPLPPSGRPSKRMKDVRAQIAALHPALVITTEARYLEVPEARPLAGVPTGRGGAWEDGVAAIFSFLKHHARHVVFLSDVPTLERSAPGCVAGHMSDVRPCTTGRSAAVRLPSVKAEELELARRNGVAVADPTSWFCTPTTCPVPSASRTMKFAGPSATPAAKWA